jgi:7-carboxy-7-deazaguanine synthase
MLDKIKYSEIFGGNTSDKPTFQGEGIYTGSSSLWLRYFGCNFECKGFGQKNPADPSTYEFNYKDFDFSKIKSIDEVPMINTGCDSAYSWSSKFKHLAPSGTASEIVDKLEKKLTGGKFVHPKSQQDCHLVFTGGEPMLRGFQNASVQIMKEFAKRDNLPYHATFETNTTQRPTEEFKEYFSFLNSMENDRFELFWSCSPKLYTSGEAWEKAIRPDVVEEYIKISEFGQLKYVVDGSERAWDEVEKATALYRKVGCGWPVWIMPVGSDVDQQENHAAKISDEALSRGYNVAARVHVYVYLNDQGR